MKRWVFFILLLGLCPLSFAQVDPLQIELTPDHFQNSIEHLKDAGLVPSDFIPAYENHGEFGPNSRVSLIPQNVHGPWDSEADGRKIWWKAHIHGLTSQGQYAGVVEFWFNLKTGEIAKPSYSPKGQVDSFNPRPAVVLYANLREATRISSSAFFDTNIYKSLSESGYLPIGYRIDDKTSAVKNSVIVSYRDVSEPDVSDFTIRLRQEKDHWQKIYEYGFIGDQEVEVHYFRHVQTGEVSRVEFYMRRKLHNNKKRFVVEIKNGKAVRKPIRTDLMSDEACRNLLPHTNDASVFIGMHTGKFEQLQATLEEGRRQIKRIDSVNGVSNGGIYTGMGFAGAQGMMGNLNPQDPNASPTPQRDIDPYEIKLTVDHFAPVIDALKQSGFLPTDFTPTYENKGPYGPNSRFTFIPTTYQGPWDRSFEGRRFWVECYIHGVHADGSYAGMIDFAINLRSGEMYRVEYSPQGGVKTFKPFSDIVLFHDLKKATQISQFAASDSKQYKSLEESGYLPPNYRRENIFIRPHYSQHQEAQGSNATSEHKIDPLEWDKVFENGFVGSRGVEVHYFLSKKTGEVNKVEFYPVRLSTHGPHRPHKILIPVHIDQSGQVTRKNVRTDLMSVEALSHVEDSLQYIQSQSGKLEKLQHELEEGRKRVVRAPPELMTIVEGKFDIGSIDREIRENRKKHKMDSEPERPTPTATEAADRLSKSLAKLVPELDNTQYRMTHLVFTQLAEQFKKLHTATEQEKLYGASYSDIRDVTLTTEKQLEKLFRGTSKSLCDEYESILAEEKNWTAELAQESERRGFVSSSEDDEYLEMILGLRQRRLEILNEFNSRLMEVTKSGIKSQGKRQDPVRYFLEQISQTTSKIIQRLGLNNITFGPDRNETKGGTYAGMGFGSAQGMFGRANPSDQNKSSDPQVNLDPLQKQYTPEDFYIAINEMKNRGIIQSDFTPTYENKGEIGPNSRIAAMRESSPGPWRDHPEQRKYWWECYIHGVDAESRYAGMVKFKINLKTGVIWEVEYSPFGDVLTYLPYDAVVLYKDLKLATRISSHAFYDMRTYKSLGESGYVPAGYRRDEERPPVMRQTHAEDKIRHEFKVFEYGYVGDQQVEVHYFMQETGEVSQVEFYPFRTSRGAFHKVDLEVGKTRDGQPIRKKFRIDLLSQEALEANRNHSVLNLIETQRSQYNKLKAQLAFAKQQVKTFLSSRLPKITFGPDPNETKGGTYLGMGFGGAQGMKGGGSNPRTSEDGKDEQTIQENFSDLLKTTTMEDALKVASRIVPVRIWPPEYARQFGEQYLPRGEEVELIQHEMKNGSFAGYNSQYHFTFLTRGVLFTLYVLRHENFHAVCDLTLPEQLKGNRHSSADQEAIFKIREFVEETLNFLREEKSVPRLELYAFHHPRAKHSFWKTEARVQDAMEILQTQYGWQSGEVMTLMYDMISHIKTAAPDFVDSNDPITEALELAQQRCQGTEEKRWEGDAIAQLKSKLEELGWNDLWNKDANGDATEIARINERVENLFVGLDVAPTVEKAKEIFFKISESLDVLPKDQRSAFVKKQLTYLDHYPHRNKIISGVGDVGHFGAGLFVQHVLEDLESKLVHGEDPRHLMEFVQHWDSVLYDYAYFGVGGKMGTLAYDLTLSKLYAKAYHAFYAETYTQLLKGLALPEMAAERSLLMKMYPNRSMLGQFLRSQAGALAAFAFSQYMNTGRIDPVNIASFQMSYLLTHLVVTSLSRGAFAEIGAFLFSHSSKGLWLLGGPYGAVVKVIQMGVSLYAANKISPHVEKAFLQMADDFKEDDAESLRYALHEKLKTNLNLDETGEVISEINLSLETSFQRRLFDLFQLLAKKEREEEQYFNTHHHVRALELQKEACEEKMNSADVQMQYSVVNSDIAIERSCNQDSWASYATLYGLPGGKDKGILALIDEGNQNKQAWLPEYMDGLSKVQRKNEMIYRTKLVEMGEDLFRGNLIETYMALKESSNRQERIALLTKYRAQKEEAALAKIDMMQDKAQMAEALAQGMAGAVGPGPGFIPPNSKSRVVKSIFEKYLEEMAYFEYKADHEEDLSKKSIYRVQAIQLQLKLDKQLDWLKDPFQTPEIPEQDAQLEQLLTFQK